MNHKPKNQHSVAESAQNEERPLKIQESSPLLIQGLNNSSRGGKSRAVFEYQLNTLWGHPPTTISTWIVQSSYHVLQTTSHNEQTTTSLFKSANLSLRQTYLIRESYLRTRLQTPVYRQRVTTNRIFADIAIKGRTQKKLSNYCQILSGRRHSRIVDRRASTTFLPLYSIRRTSIWDDNLKSMAGGKIKFWILTFTHLNGVTKTIQRTIEYNSSQAAYKSSLTISNIMTWQVKPV